MLKIDPLIGLNVLALIERYTLLHSPSARINPHVRTGPPRILRKPPTDLLIEPGGPLDVSVEVSGFPEPRIEWLNSRGDVVGTGRVLHLERNFE